MTTSPSTAVERLKQDTLRLADAGRVAKEKEDITTTIVVVTQYPGGLGVANVYKDGILAETPMQIGMIAQEAATKARRFAVGMLERGIKPSDFN